ncbi:MAG: hypothetical protein EA392_07670 [Cryomorphaceae bacterium]|nr:MAG: hypothetical protein EA392_07670 [Cryomorphaceae bacterium]
MKTFLQLGLITFLIIFPLLLAAQPSSGGAGPPCFPPPCIPIDGGTTLLIAAGLAIGGKKAYDLRKNR